MKWFLLSGRSAIVWQQRPDLSLLLKLFVASGGKEICGTVPCVPAPSDFSVCELGAAFDSFDHAVY